MSRITNLPRLLSALRKDFPLSMNMWQVVKDTQDGLMEANFYIDEWPDFTTVISQEFAPRLSEVADLRIHTRSKELERVMHVINGGNLLSNSNRQNIMYLTRQKQKDEVTPYLVDALSSHPAAKGREVKHYSIPIVCIPEYPERVSNFYALPPGIVLKDLKPEHAELVAKNYGLENWFTELSPFEEKRDFIEHLIRKYIGIGAFLTENPSEPIAWNFRRQGGIHGIGFTAKEYRNKNLYIATAMEVIVRAGKEKVIMGQTTTPNRDGLKPLIDTFGLSHAVVIHSPVAH